jgi:hypothetical protein
MLVELDRVLEEDSITNSSKHGNWLLKNLHIRFLGVIQCVCLLKRLAILDYSQILDSEEIKAARR